MFIAVVQENFDVTEDEKRIYQVKSFLQNKDYSAPSQGISLASMFRFGRQKTKEPRSRQAAFEMLTKQAVVESFLDQEQQHARPAFTRSKPLSAAVSAQSGKYAAAARKRTMFGKLKEKVLGLFREREPNPFYSFQ
jgi:hypothetical protein